MARLTWDEAANRLYETGVKNVVLYPTAATNTADIRQKGIAYTGGVAWNGVISVTESPSGAEPTPLYADDMKYLNLLSVEEFAATIEAYAYPKAFAECNGEKKIAGVTLGQQPRKTFGLCYKTTLGNAESGNSHGYKLHLVYNCLAAPSEKAYSTINDSPEAITFSWELSTTPVTDPIYYFGTTDSEVEYTLSIITIDSTKVSADKMAAIEDLVYGTSVLEGETTNTGGVPTLPTPGKIFTILKG